MALVPTMARDRKTARTQDQIRVLLSQGLSIRKVALALGISRQSVRKFGTEQPKDVGATSKDVSRFAGNQVVGALLSIGS